jgi:nitrite reductase/ring-hydroxylating ferredoxin subunit
MLIILKSKLNKLFLFYQILNKKMKKYLLSLFFLGLFGCCSNDTKRNVNPFLPDYSFSYPINLTLPSFQPLTSNVNAMYLNAQGVGVKGIIVLRVSETDYRAWEAACPNQYPSDCSTMTIVGLDAKCACDNQKYSLFTGVGSGQYTMKPYQVEILNATNIRIFN